MIPKLSNVSSTFRTHLSRFATLWRESHRQAAKDLRARWRRCGLWLLLAAWFVALLICFIWLLLPKFSSFDLCLPDGSFAMDPSHFRYLSSSGFFQITLAAGNMTFTQVKAIDIIWDIFVGRGGQALIAYISWRVFAKYVTTSMEVTPVTFGTYRTVFLPDGGLFLAILFTIRDFVTRHGLHSKLAMVFMVYTMMFTFLYPTLASAMTGYSANVEAVINTTAGEYVPHGSFGLVYFVIHDGWRIPDLQGNHLVIEPFRSYGFKYCYGTSLSKSDLQACDMQREVTKCYTPWHSATVADVHMDALEYGLNGENMTKSTFGSKSLEPPALNISAPSLYQLSSYQNQQFGMTRNTSLQLWGYDNQTYDSDYMQQNGSCQAVLDYNWGFSYVQLFIMLLFQIVWTFGLYIMWLRAYMVMKKRGRGREDVAGQHKAVFELAAAMREQMHEPTKEEANDLSAFTEAKLRQRITKALRGGSISYTAPLLQNGESGQKWDTKAWIRSYKLSIAAMFACVAAMFLNVTTLLPSTIIFLFPLPAELMLTLYIGSTRKSRIVLFVWIFLIITIPTQTIFLLL